GQKTIPADTVSNRTARKVCRLLAADGWHWPHRKGPFREQTERYANSISSPPADSSTTRRCRYQFDHVSPVCGFSMFPADSLRKAPPHRECPVPTGDERLPVAQIRFFPAWRPPPPLREFCHPQRHNNIHRSAGCLSTN